MAAEGRDVKRVFITLNWDYVDLAVGVAGAAGLEAWRSA